jgi:hypothetical protein
MIDDAKSRLTEVPYSVADQIHMGGFSASATFSNRFTFLYPEKVQTLSTGGSNVLPLPKASHDGTSLAYPLGTADYEQLTGGEFDLEAWAAVNRYLYVGQNDQPLPSTDERGYYYGSGRYLDTVEEVYGRNRVTERFPLVKEEYKAVSDSAEFEIYEEMGHEINEAARKAIEEFHLEHSPTPDPSSVEAADESQSNSQAPGFGIGAALLGLAGAIAAAKNRL